MFLSCFLQLISIGLSDAIEFYFNKDVHRYHNCPDIMRMDFDNYSYTHAFISGILCSWFLVLFQCLFFLILNVSNTIPIHIVSIINMIIPILINPYTVDDIFMCHKLLYLLNISSFFYICIVKIL